MGDAGPKPNIPLGVIGAVAGGTVGFFVFKWIYSQGFYALVIPPALLGLAGGYCVRGRSVPFAVFCAVAGLALALLTEWNVRPFLKDKSLVFFLAHLQSMLLITQIMIVIGTVISYRLALGMDAPPKSGN